MFACKNCKEKLVISRFLDVILCQETASIIGLSSFHFLLYKAILQTITAFGFLHAWHLRLFRFFQFIWTQTIACSVTHT